MLPAAHVQGLSRGGTRDHHAHNIAQARTKDPRLSLSEAPGPTGRRGEWSPWVRLVRALKIQEVRFSCSKESTVSSPVLCNVFRQNYSTQISGYV